MDEIINQYKDQIMHLKDCIDHMHDAHLDMDGEQFHYWYVQTFMKPEPRGVTQA